jgi:hypothetical protein
MVVVALLVAAALLAAYLWVRSLGASATLTAGRPPGVTPESVESGEGGVRVVWSRSPYASGYEVEERIEGGQVNDTVPVDSGDKTSFAGDREPGSYCYRVRPVVEDGNDTLKGPYSEAKCVDVAAQPTPTPTPTPADGASPEPTGTGGAEFEPRRWFVLYGSIPMEDADAYERANQLVRALQSEGATGIKLRDSRQSELLPDAEAGLFVVFSDDLATEAEAAAECRRFEHIADCYWQEAP